PTDPPGITATGSPSTVSLFPGGTGLYYATQWRFGTSGCCQFPLALGSTGNGYLYFSAYMIGGGSVYLTRYAPAGTSSDVVRTITIQHYDLSLPSNLSPFLSIFYTDGTVQTVQLRQSANTLATETISLFQSKTINYVQISLQVTSSIVIGTFSEYFSFVFYGSSLIGSTSPTIQPGSY